MAVACGSVRQVCGRIAGISLRGLWLADPQSQWRGGLLERGRGSCWLWSGRWWLKHARFATTDVNLEAVPAAAGQQPTWQQRWVLWRVLLVVGRRTATAWAPTLGHPPAAAAAATPAQPVVTAPQSISRRGRHVCPGSDECVTVRTAGEGMALISVCVCVMAICGADNSRHCIRLRLGMKG